MDTTPVEGRPSGNAGGNEQPSAHEQFLLDEGLELMASFKAIRDSELRAKIRQLVASIAAEQGRG